MNRIFAALFLCLVCLPAHAAQAPKSKWVPLPYQQMAAFGIFQTTSSLGPAPLFIPAANNNSANWTKAGLVVIGGIPTRNTQCGSTVSPSGLTPPTAGDDASLINAAITACTAGQVVLLAIGTFQLDTSEIIQVGKGITLRGSGNCTTNGAPPYCQTVIQMRNGAWPDYLGSPTGYKDGQCGVSTGTPPSGTTPGSFANCPFTNCAIICMQPSVLVGQNAGWASCQAFNANPTTNNCGVTFTADAAQGDTTVFVSATSSFSVGDWVMMDEAFVGVSTANPVGGGQANIQATSDFLSTSPTPVTSRIANPDVNCNYSLCTDRLNQDIHLITAINPGVSLTFDSPLSNAFRTSGSHDARVYWLTLAGSTTKQTFLTQAGVENMSVYRGTNGGIEMFYCAYCWVKNVDTGFGVKGSGAVYSARVNFTGSVFHDCVDCTNDGAEYPLALDTGTTEALVDNNITFWGGKGMVGRTSNSNVVAYNYVDNQRYSPAAIGDWFLDMSVNGSHNAGTHHFLFEGNYGNNCDNDETHGNNFYHVYFRNQCSGLRATFVDATTCNNTVNDSAGLAFIGCATSNAPGSLRAGGPMAFNYWHAFAGNVMGLAGTTTTAGGWVYFRCAAGGCSGVSQTNKTIWMTGWTGSEWSSHGDHNLDGTNSPAFIFRNGNYDYVNAAIVDNAAGYSQAFPNSFYLPSSGASPPGWWPNGSTTYPYPPFCSTCGTPVALNSLGGSALPAKARFDAGTPFVQP